MITNDDKEPPEVRKLAVLLVQHQGDYWWALNQHAYMVLVESEPVSDGVMQLALRCVRRSLELQESVPGLTTLGIALFRVVEFSAALKAFERADALSHENWGETDEHGHERGFFQAMVQWQTGAHERARELLSRSNPDGESFPDAARPWYKRARDLIR